MQSTFRHALSRQVVFSQPFGHSWLRHASLTGAIGRGIRKARRDPVLRLRRPSEVTEESPIRSRIRSQDAEQDDRPYANTRDRKSDGFANRRNSSDRPGHRPSRFDREGDGFVRNDRFREQDRNRDERSYTPASRRDHEPFKNRHTDASERYPRSSGFKQSEESPSGRGRMRDRDEDQEKKPYFSGPDRRGDPAGNRRDRRDAARPRRRDFNVVAPHSVPYTTAGSEFLYGTFAVDAAIRAYRRKLYKLYIYCAEEDEDRSMQDQEYDRGVEKRALAAGLDVLRVGGNGWKFLLKRMADNRPHNGLVLEASPIPQLPINALERQHLPQDPVQVQVGHQSEEDREVNGSSFDISSDQASIRSTRDPTHYPVLLFLDCITDSGNVGAILRTACYLGVDGIIIPDHGTAPLSAVTVKASAGAAEYLPIFRVKDEVKFMKASQQNGWKFFAAVAPDSVSSGTTAGHSRVADHVRTLAPSVLMLGNEAEGLRPRLAKLADDVASIDGGQSKPDIVDSLNVSVAAALLMHKFLSPQPTLEGQASAPATPQGELW